MEYRNYYNTPRDAVSDDMLSELLGENEQNTELYGNYNKPEKTLYLRNESENVPGTNPGCSCGCDPCASRNRSRTTFAPTRNTSPNCRGEYPTQSANEMDGTWQNPTLSGNQLAMVYVPVQEFEDLYDEDEGLSRGTIFKKLDLPFYPGCSGCAMKGGCTR